MNNLHGKEGPTRTQYAAHSEDHCSGCKWLVSKMVKSGRDPVHRYWCAFPDAPPRGKRLDPEGEYLGESDLTPLWCPVSKIEGK